MSSNAARTHAPFGTLLSIDSGTTQLGNARASVYAGGGAGMHDVNPASNTPASNTAAIMVNHLPGITPAHGTSSTPISGTPQGSAVPTRP